MRLVQNNIYLYSTPETYETSVVVFCHVVSQLTY